LGCLGFFGSLLLLNCPLAIRNAPCRMDNRHDVSAIRVARSDTTPSIARDGAFRPRYLALLKWTQF
jgi:hypothetical protein